MIIRKVGEEEEDGGGGGEGMGWTGNTHISISTSLL
jgi:hypothetical protein